MAWLLAMDDPETGERKRVSISRYASPWAPGRPEIQRLGSFRKGDSNASLMIVNVEWAITPRLLSSTRV